MLASGSEASKHISYDIPRQRADQALIEFAEQADVTFIFPFDEARKITANRLVGNYTLKEAISVLLQGTGLQPEFRSDGGMTIRSDAQTVDVEQKAEGENAVSMNSEQKKSFFKRLAAVIVVGFTATASAQSANTEDEDSFVIEEVMVTAQRREQSLQDVPIAISAFSAKDIELSQIDDVGDYFDRTPNVNFTDAGGQRQSRTITMRGIAKLAGNVGVTTFGFYVDGFNLASTTVNPPLMDIERIEVLRGPQPTYFGRNAVGGAVNIITNKPAPEFYARFGAGAARYGTYRADIVLNVPLSDKFFIRASGNFETSDGIVRNVNEVGGRSSHEYINGRLAARWLITDKLTMDFSFIRSDETQDILEHVPTGILQPGLVPTFVTEPDLTGTGAWPENKNKVNLDFPDKSEQDLDVYTAKLFYEHEKFTLTSISGLITRDWFANRDLDFSRLDAVPTFETWEFEDKSTEIRIQSAGDNKLDWSFGAVYAKFKMDYNQDVFAGADFFGGVFAGMNISDFHQRDDTETKAIFAELNWYLNDRLTLTAGGRYTKETTDSQIDFINFGSPAPQTLGELKTDDFSPRLALGYELNENLTGYISISKGFKSGGLQPGNAFSPTFDKEVLWSYEAGIKGTAMNQRLRFALAAFYMDWQDLQVSARTEIFNPDGTITFNFATANAASASSKGVELELFALPVEDLQLSLIVGYNDAKFEDYKDAVLSTGEVVDLSGKRIPLSTKWNANANAQYNFSVASSSDGFVRAEYVYRSSYASNTTGLVSTNPYYADIPSRGIFHLRTGASWGKYNISAFIENVLDKDWYTGSFDNFSFSGRLNTPHPRRYGIRFQVEFG